MDEFIGMIKIFAGNFAPRGWAFCQGQSMNINSNAALYAILGTSYGGDGQTTFKLPNLCGSVPVGSGLSTSGTTYAIGKTGGVEQNSVTMANMPPHNHTITGSITMMGNADSSGNTDPSGSFYGPTETNAYNSAPGGDMAPLVNTLGVGITGNGTPYDNRQPFMAVNYIICISGLYPPRN